MNPNPSIMSQMIEKRNDQSILNASLSNSSLKRKVTINPVNKSCVNTQRKPKKELPGPGFEPGLLRPQRRVLTTRRSRLLILNPVRFWITRNKIQTGLM